MRPKLLVVSLVSVVLVGCATEGNVIDSGDGTYLITTQAFASPGGVDRATSIAYQDAENFCAAKDEGRHAVVIHVNASETREISFGGSNALGGGFGGSSSPAGKANVRFRCGD